MRGWRRGRIMMLLSVHYYDTACASWCHCVCIIMTQRVHNDATECIIMTQRVHRDATVCALLWHGMRIMMPIKITFRIILHWPVLKALFQLNFWSYILIMIFFDLIFVAIRKIIPNHEYLNYSQSNVLFATRFLHVRCVMKMSGCVLYSLCMLH